ncbi:hypothetical protein BDN70DRAFT_876962 [Pholiota conissans]|uniref:Uncharacterized protein n=1 Tax=Pholiota conissans TaxID=109636 RepID=A0A9P6D205_9AGAR|nr:hypothetical protein BDN70DRAFT_876962 [Pholiota conissans]
MFLRTRRGENSATGQLGKPLCIVCGARPAFNSGLKAYSTCGLSCANRLKVISQVLDTNITTVRPLCVVCKMRPRFNNGKRAFPTCGFKCAKTKKVQDTIISSLSIVNTING